MGPSLWQLLIVLVIIILIFGTKKLKNIGGDLGGALKNFKDAVKDEKGGENNTDAQPEAVEKQDAEFTETSGAKEESPVERK